MRTDRDMTQRERERQAEALQRSSRDRRQDATFEPGRPDEPRSWMARTRDEVASWLGSTSAMRRRQWDEAAGDHTGQGPTRDMDDDTRIVDELNQRLTVDRSLDASGVKASAQDGVVTLDGVVPTLASAQRAEGVAMAIHGVKRVDNKLVVA